MAEVQSIKKKICMLGSFGVGKTSLVRRFVQSDFSEKYQSTVGLKVDKKEITVEGKGVMLMLWDMAGEDDRAPVKIQQVQDATGYLLVVDGCRAKTMEVALSLQERVQAQIGVRPFILLCNKADEKPRWEIPDSTFAELAERGWTILETSAKSGQNVEEAFLGLTAQMLAKAAQEAEDDD